MPAMLKGLPPVFDNVTVCAALAVPINWLPNDNVAGLNMATPAVTPVPLKGTLCGEPAAESVTSSAALRVPAAVGVNVTEAVQCAPAAKDVPQVLDI